MNTSKTVDFILTYAKVYGQVNSPLCEIAKDIQIEMDFYAEYYDMQEQTYIDLFLEKYKDMRECELTYEVLSEVANGSTFFSACREWDI